MSIDSPHILVVDDNPATRYSTARVLRGAGWTVSEAATGGEALKFLDQGVSLVVLDVNLPDIHGFEVCRQIRLDQRCARIPVIHLSASFVNDSHKVQGLEAGANGYLVHPIEPPVLVATVNAFLRAYRAELELEELLVRERAARDEAERANRLKDDFLATLSHELRTPLHSILGWVQMLKLGMLEPGEMQECADVIERNAQAQAQMISDLLDVSRIVSGKLRLDVQAVDLRSVIEAAVIAILPAADAKGTRITKMYDAAAGAVMGDPARLQQVVWNLVNNAVKFTPKGGKIEVLLRRVDSYVEIAVSDTGQGISPELLPRVFDRFRQGDASTTRSHGGLGLGLAIGKELVEMHGGSISAHSAGLNQGATFTVRLPLSIMQSPPASSTTGPIDDSGQSALVAVRLDGIRVLVVDDELDSRSMLMRALVSCGAIAHEVSTAAQAIEALAEFKPHVLVSDLGMPNQDGFEMIRKIRAKGYSVKELPAIALTGFARVEDRQRALLAGFQVHTSKPIELNELTAAIASVAGRTGRTLLTESGPLPG